MTCNPSPQISCDHTVLFGVVRINGCEVQELDGCLSPIIRVVDCPVIIRGYGLAKCEKMYLEMLGGPDNTLSEPVYKECGCKQALTAKHNTMVLDQTGVYRLNRCVCDPAPQSDAHVEYELLRTAPRGTCAPKAKCGCGTK